jgi:hypothetical protein
MHCSICGFRSTSFARARLLRKYEVQYFACDNCGFIQTESPYWLDEAYAESIAKSDVGLVGRNIKLSHVTSVVIGAFFGNERLFLDFAGGNGMFVRLMRDKGFEFHWSDKFTVNQFAVGFEDRDIELYGLLTAFEVFEHLADPVRGVEEMLSRSSSILLSTTLVPSARPGPQDWWYYALDTGQHISLYSQKSLRMLAGRFGLNFYTNGFSVHLMTKKRLTAAAFRLLALPPASALLAPMFLAGRKSLLEQDYWRITGRPLK